MTLDLLQMSISRSIVAASRHWRRICQNTLVNYGISEACAMPLLMILRLGDGVRQVTVAHAAGLESPSLVRLLDQLCAADIVLRTEDPTDRRAKSLSLTDSGRTLALSIEDELKSLRHKVLKNVEISDLEATLRVLHAFEDAGHEDPDHHDAEWLS
ncbi:MULTISPECIES: MarR family winged helix-turn-helix transcriptional regulator [unclassified Pseudomonas]|uniref:MarR family winged helix-turn-helix transcriptional regulator n=1 Tax=unclassified Pseudomonas TaxID=196821 RepID=UPI002AC8E52D|nr:MULTISPECIES: MarR family winged helix-turn-helix transcriptional regulator [unclassified Pseudomonas]MEB0040831.1 MarR family winged helix-turn-helix transcriptional regulator [Pseudomonas sp. MH10]MEB0119395.1 MarR family winged helix-turn-helix transcriptional regulator [Pseudomonas sp. CCI1.2]WPX65831.1 MarR family winged helix-turn-helix transcriptional regulator [Pseudomonas sp. MH10]